MWEWTLTTKEIAVIDTDPLDELLSRSAPATTARTPALREELTRMAVASASERRASVSRRRLVIGTGVATALLLASAGTAAATGIIDWRPWAQDPDVVYTYTLPSGEPCELRVVFDDDATGAVARDIVAGADLDAEIDVDAAIADMRAATSIGTDEFGNSWDMGYGTEYYPGIDEEYDIAVGHAVSGFLVVELRARGIPDAAQNSTYASTCSIERANG
ncbi:MAG: hypothetical protein DI534_09580 [Leifsonia xyli]|nr:MAG: hypothetical protein DI534_09580 [Leifsonia xyli]